MVTPITFWDPSQKPDMMSNCTLVMSKAYARLENLPAASHIRRLIVQLYSRLVVAPEQITDDHELHAGFIYNCFVEVHAQVHWNMDEEEKDFQDSSAICDYHIHDMACSPRTKNLIETEQED